MRRYSFLALAIGLIPTLCQAQCMTCGPGGGMEFSPGMSAGSWSAGSGGGYAPYESVAAGGGGGGDQLYPYDSPEPWLHGYFQEMPAYGGYYSFRPHNYRHVLAQMQRAGRWGIDPTMPISHQWYHRYRQRAGMHPNFGTLHGSTAQPNYGNYANAAPAPRATAPAPAYHSPQPLQHAGAIERGYTGSPIPGIHTPSYQLSQVPDGRQMSDDYLARIEELNSQLQQQNFRIQSMQQQLANRPEPQFAAPVNGYTHAQPPMLGTPSTVPSGNGLAPNAGYQEIPAPGAQPGLLATPPAMRSAAPAPGTVYSNAPAPSGNYNYGGQPSGYPMNNQPMPMMNQPAPQPSMAPQPMLQMPAAPYGGGQAWPGSSTMIVPNNGIVPSSGTMWQGQPVRQPASAPMYTQPSYPTYSNAAPGYGAPQQLGPVHGARPAVPQQPGYPSSGYFRQ